MSWIQRLLGISTRSHPSTSDISAIVARYKDALMTSTGVVSVGLGEDANGKPAIIVGMSTTREGLASLPDSLEGVPVVIRQVGTIGAQNNDE